jgi:hypothetical protein
MNGGSCFVLMGFIVSIRPTAYSDIQTEIDWLACWAVLFRTILTPLTTSFSADILTFLDY